MKKSSEEKLSTQKYSEAKGLIFLGIGFILLLSLLSFHSDASQRNWLGLMGWALAFGLSWLFGLSSYLLIAFFGWLGWQRLLNKNIPSLTTKIIYFSFFLASTCLLLNLCAEVKPPLGTWFEKKIYTETFLFDLPYLRRITRYNLGGVPFYYLYKDLPVLNLQKMLSNVGVGLTFSITMMVSFLLVTEMRLLPLFLSWKKNLTALKKTIRNHFSNSQTEHIANSPSQTMNALEKALTQPSFKIPPIYSNKNEPIKICTMADKEEKNLLQATSFIKQPKPSSKRQSAIESQRMINGDFTAYQLPPLSLLNQPKKVDQPSLKKELKRQAEILEETLLSFGIEAKVGQINCGPTITSFEVHPAIGVKVQKIKTLENDIALNLQAKSIRIIAPIPGKAAVGVEIPSLISPRSQLQRALIAISTIPAQNDDPPSFGQSCFGRQCHQRSE